MIKLYRYDISGLAEREYELAFSSMPDNIKERILRKKNATERTLSLVGYTLALGAAREILGESSPKIEFMENGKPYFENIPLKFSISHSYSRVIVAVSERDIGADIERRREVNGGIAGRFFTARERQRDFFEIWTKKEAYGKCKGGMTAAFNRDVCDLDFYTEDDGEYVIAVYEE